MTRFEELREAGWPIARLTVPGLHLGPVIVLATNLDGSLWVYLPTGGTLAVAVEPVLAELRSTGSRPAHPAWQPVNQYKLSPAQISLLTSFAAAGSDGRADHEHRVPGVDEHRRALVTKGLVAERHGVQARSPRGGSAHVWAITHAGRHALCQPCPTPFSDQTTVSA